MVDLVQFRHEMEAELRSILRYWMRYATDEIHGGFVGKIDHANRADLYADKGSVLNSRILWTFSAAYRCTNNADYLLSAQTAYRYFIDHFIDKEYGGVYWTIDYKGNSADGKKQVYAQSFAIYALSEYYRATGETAALQAAIDIYKSIESTSYDAKKGGYIDAFAEDWSVVSDVRLSAKDANEKKTMNTHLHIVEAYSNLYRAWPGSILQEKIKSLLQNFKDHIIDPNGHLQLFFDEAWHSKSSLVSYGHDIEAAWLLQEAAETINDEAWVKTTREIAVRMVNAAREGLDNDGGLWYEYEPAGKHLVKEKHWWPQAEAIVGFFNAWQVSGDEAYVQLSWESWGFVKRSVLDKNGEWVWGIREDNTIMTEQDKAGLWKCPYHNGRACIEIIKRISEE